MTLTSTQDDALRELINISYGRATSGLAQMTHARVAREAPALRVLSIAELEESLHSLFRGALTCVNQAFDGPLSGTAMLLLDRRSAAFLAELIMPSNLPAEDQSEAEILTEVGNIVLNACLGVFGNLLRVQMGFSVPDFSVGSVGALF